jgi:hypothetical protein
MPHLDGCDIAQCHNCGGQRLTCQCEDSGTDVWTGYSPGVKEAEEYHFFCKIGKISVGLGAIHVPVACPFDDPDAEADVNQMKRSCVWDKDKKRFIKPV